MAADKSSLTFVWWSKREINALGLVIKSVVLCIMCDHENLPQISNSPGRSHCESVEKKNQNPFIPSSYWRNYPAECLWSCSGLVCLSRLNMKKKSPRKRRRAPIIIKFI